MNPRRLALVFAGSIGLLALSAADAAAQNGGWRATGGGQGGGRATTRATSRPTVVTPRDPHGPIAPQTPGSLLNPVTYRVPVAIIPAILMSDGSIFANFGFGYEPVVRVCGGAAMGAVVASNGVVLQPAPAASQQTVTLYTPAMLIQSGYVVHQVVVSDMGRLACHNRDGSGLVYIYR